METSTSVTNITRRSRQMLTKHTLTSSIENGLATDANHPGQPANVRDSGGGGSNSHRPPGSIPGTPTGRHDRTAVDSDPLEKRGIRIVDSNLKNFTNVSPSEVADYYRSLGEWQNVLPKTDYTYSPVSVYYTKKINGVIPIVPNMSRRDIWTSQEETDNRINSQYAKNYSVSSTTSTLRSRYFNWRWARSRSPDVDSDSSHLYNSGDVPGWGRHHGRGLTDVLGRSLSVLVACHRYVYTATIHGVVTRTSAVSRKTSAALSNGLSSPMKLVFLLAALTALLYTLFCGTDALAAAASGTASRLGDLVGGCGSVLVLPVRKLFVSLCSLVVDVLALTYASATFVLNVIWAAGRSGADAASTVFVAPIYRTYVQIFHATPTIFSAGDSKDRRDAAAMDTATAELLFRRLLDANTAHLVQKVVSSPELGDLVDDKVRRLREHEDARHVELARDLDERGGALERRVEALETQVAELITAAKATESQSDERYDELRKRLVGVKEEVQASERRIEDALVVLLSEMLDVVSSEKSSPLAPPSHANVRERFASLFAAVEQAHFKVDRLSREFWAHTNNASDQLERTKSELEVNLRTSVNELVERKLQEWRASSLTATVAAGERFDQLEEFVKEVVRKALEVYDADKTGQVDYALESAGGVVLSTRCTETKTTNAQFSILGIPLWYTSRSPRTVIQPGVHPGECWAFPGSTGYLVIQLAERIIVTGFTLEHIPRALASNGTIDSAPKDFAVWALRYETDQEPKFLGQFRFDSDGPSLQYYEAVRLDDPYQIVELKILSNHGKMDYTCLYRFRVHGLPV